MEKFHSLQIQEIITKTEQFFLQKINIDYGNKTNPEKWSKKEILGHLIDSAINNLKRFTEAQFSNEPYQVIAYSQNELVIVNGYQEQDINKLLELWSSLNFQISCVVAKLSKESLEIDIILSNGIETNLDFLINDYIEHLKYHLNQIFENEFNN